MRYVFLGLATLMLGVIVEEPITSVAVATVLLAISLKKES